MDSPGHCAQYCTYTLMEETTKKIVNVAFLDKREASGKSGNMEKAGLIAVLAALKDHDVVVSELVSDAHMAISAMISKYNLFL